MTLSASCPQAITARDSMAKSLYSALFDWIVLRINHALLNKKDMEECVSVRAPTPACSTRQGRGRPRAQCRTSSADGLRCREPRRLWVVSGERRVSPRGRPKEPDGVQSRGPSAP